MLNNLENKMNKKIDKENIIEIINLKKTQD